jgi:hypothetical protein
MYNLFAAWVAGNGILTDMKLLNDTETMRENRNGFLSSRGVRNKSDAPATLFPLQKKGVRS